MICTKCNSEIPNGARFCPVCGNACGSASDVKPAAAAPEPENKTFCGKCGLELRRGAKFCAVCGAPAAAGDIKPTVNSGSTFGGGVMSAVSLDKPNASDNLVAAMSAAPSNVPTPSNSVPMPSNGSGYSSGFGSSDAGYSSSAAAPAFIPESPVATAPTAPAADMGNAFGDMGAAAVVATPIKKKTGAKVGIIIAAVLVVLVAAAAAFFFTNKATALSLIMGKSNYAAMVEGNSIKAAAEKLDLPALSDGIKSASGVISSLSSVNYGLVGDSSLGLSNTSVSPKAQPMMSVVTEDGAVDFEALISSYNKLMMDTYGMNSMSASLSMDVKLSDPVKSLIGSDFDEILKLFNDLTFTTTIGSSADKLGASIGLESGSDALNAKTVFTKDGEVYLVLPFISETGFKVKLPNSNGTADVTEYKELELDPKELERLIGELVELYVAEYKESAIEMENGELSAAGLTATGKLITAEFKGDDLSDLIYKLAEHVAEDEYLSGKIVEFVNGYGEEMTKQDFKDAIMDAAEFDADSSDKLVISTVIDNGGKVLAKSFKAVNGDKNVKLTYVDSKEQFTLEVSNNGNTVVSLVHDITSANAGTVTVKCTDGDDGSVTVKMTYSDMELAKFCGRDTVTGKFTVGVELPSDFTDDVPAEIGNLSNIKFTFSNAVDGQNTMESSVGLDVGNLGSVTLRSSVTAENSDAALAIPSDIIDLGDMKQAPDEATMKRLEEYLKLAGDKIKALGDGPFGDLLGASGLLDELDYILGSVDPVPPDSVSYDDLLALGTQISSTMLEISEYRTTYNVNDSALSERVSTLTGDLYKLFNDLNAKMNGDVSEAEFKTFTDRFNTLRKQADALEKDYRAKAGQNTSAPNTPSTPANPSGVTVAETLDYDSMTDDRLTEVLFEYEMRYFNMYDEDDIYYKIYDSPELKKMLDACDTAYNKACDDFDQFLDAYVNGNYSVALLRNLRKSTKTFAVAVEKLEQAVQIAV